MKSAPGLAAATAVVYHVAPACDVRWRSVLPGVTLFVAGWIATTIGFGVYITELSSYGETYGSISGIIILLLWLYVVALLLLLGGELNATIEQYREAQQARRLRLAERREELSPSAFPRVRRLAPTPGSRRDETVRLPGSSARRQRPEV